MGKSFQSCGMYIIFISGESRFKVVLCIYHHVFINGESRFKVAVCIYHHALIKGNCWKSFQSCGMCILSCVHQQESHFKIAVCRYSDVFINRKVISKLRYVYITMRSSKGKSFQNCGMYISSCICQWESHLKAAE